MSYSIEELVVKSENIKTHKIKIADGITIDAAKLHWKKMTDQPPFKYWKCDIDISENHSLQFKILMQYPQDNFGIRTSDVPELFIILANEMNGDCKVPPLFSGLFIRASKTLESAKQEVEILVMKYLTSIQKR